MAQYGGKFVYHDWKKEGRGSLEYGVIDWRLPNDAKVGIIGDWGTGMDDSIGLLQDLMAHKPDAIIHVGDIYYSGTPEECSTNFADPITRVFDQVLGQGKRIPVFTLPGNHDYYALGYGFYPMLARLNNDPKTRQDASYFCLRTEDDGWQFLGMDTGWADANPANQLNPNYAGPWVQPSELEWHRDKLEHFSGSTVLLSHHQLFTANAKINGMASSQSEFPYLNAFLMSAFQPFFRDRVAAWLWGHEHNLVLYKNGLFGLAKGRLEGASAFEEAVDEDPYKNKYPEYVSYLDPKKYRVSKNPEGYFSHSYSIIDLGGRSNPSAPVTASYYEFPSWYKKRPSSPKGKFIFTESYELPTPSPQQEVKPGASVHLSIEGGLAFISTLHSGMQYDYPTVGTKPVKLKLIAASGKPSVLKSGTKILIRTTEAKAGDYNLLGAFGGHWLYYYIKKKYLHNWGPNETWTIVKVDTRSSTTIHYGDAVYFINKAYSPQTMSPTNDDYFTTTKEKPPTLFVIQKT